MAAPLPQGLIHFAPGDQPQAHRLVAQLENELRDGSVSDTELLPDRVLPISILAQLRQQSMTQSPDGQGRLLNPRTQQLERRRIFQKKESVVHEHQQRLSGEEMNLVQRPGFPARQFELMSE